MPGKNGVLRLGDLTPETRPVELIRDGEAVVLRGYVAGRRCPGTVKAEVSAARLTFAQAPPGPERERAWFAFLRDSTLAVVPGLEFSEAEALAGDDEARHRLLVYLEWEEDQAEDASAEGDDDDPEVSGEETETTPDFSPPSSEPSAAPPETG